jgi:hypothetical protein
LETKRRILLTAAIVALLLFVGANIYPILCPTHWNIRDCHLKSDIVGLLRSDTLYLTDAREVEVYVSKARSRGEQCTVTPVKACVWYDW